MEISPSACQNMTEDQCSRTESLLRRPTLSICVRERARERERASKQAKERERERERETQSGVVAQFGLPSSNCNEN